MDHHWTLQTHHQVLHLRKRSEPHVNCIAMSPSACAMYIRMSCQSCQTGMQRSTGSERTKIVASHAYSVRKSLSV